MTRHADIIVAGHICLDVIPSFPARSPRELKRNLLQPGSLTRVGSAVCATGGAVANVGLALHRLGVAVRMIGRLGDDMFGRQILSCICAADPKLADTLRCVPGETTSYTLVVNPPNLDRFFLHCPGANDRFSARDLKNEALAGAKIFHFGYPPLMRSIYADNGAELRKIMRKARQRGLATSLDMASIDPASDAGRANWPLLLKRVLPEVDVFLPSLDELLFMLDRPMLTRLMRKTDSNIAAGINAKDLRKLSDRLLAMGAAIVAIKLGDRGLYVRATENEERLRRIRGISLSTAWRGCEIVAPCFKVRVAGTTGSGDCTIAGFLAALLQGEQPAQVAEAAVACGACSVEQPDAVSGVIPWPDMKKRVARGWPRCLKKIYINNS